VEADLLDFLFVLLGEVVQLLEFGLVGGLLGVFGGLLGFEVEILLIV
jgi:hypothetical protein